MPAWYENRYKFLFYWIIYLKCAQDHDDGAADDRLGVVSVCLADLFAHPGGVFELKDAPLRNNGKLCGMLSAKFVTFHSNGPDEQNKPFMDKVAAAKVMTD